MVVVEEKIPPHQQAYGVVISQSHIPASGPFGSPWQCHILFQMMSTWWSGWPLELSSLGSKASSIHQSYDLGGKLVNPHEPFFPYL